MHLVNGKNLWKGARKNITFSFSENFIKQKAAKRHSKQKKIRTGENRSGQKNAGKEGDYLRKNRSILDLAMRRTESLPPATIS